MMLQINGGCRKNEKGNQERVWRTKVLARGSGAKRRSRVFRASKIVRKGRSWIGIPGST